MLLQVLAVEKHQLQWICKHLGHTEQIHKSHYQGTSGLIECIEMGKLMLLQEHNLVHRFAGKKFSEIQFDGMYYFFCAAKLDNVSINYQLKFAFRLHIRLLSLL